MLRATLTTLIFLSFPATTALAQTGGEVPAAETTAPTAEPRPVETIPVEAPEKPADKPTTAIAVTYDKGVAFATYDGTFLLRAALRNQLRFEVLRPTDDGAETSSHFFIPRTRLQLEGHVFGQDNRYKLEFAFGDRGSFAFVKDLYIEKALAEKVWFRFGQWKRPFNRQELVSDFGSEFNERAITAEFVGGGRDLGVALHNDYEKSPEGLEWVVGVFNRFSGGSDRPNGSTAVDCVEDPTTMELECDVTTTPPTTVPADFAPAVVARVGWNHGGIKGYSEGDLEGGPLRWAIGASYKIDLADLEGGDAMSHGVQADAIVKVSGFDLQLGVYLMKLAGGDAELGAMAQAGWFLTPKHVQVAARFAFVPAGPDETELEARGAFNWYWKGHAWKWATDAGVLAETTDGAKPRVEVRSMMQMTF